MASSSKSEQGEITTKGVLAYAAQLCRQASMARVKDPHASLYEPSADTARKLCSQLGPVAAKAELARRALVVERRREEEEARAKEARARLREVHLVAVDEERQQRDRMSWGQRLDQALLALHVQSDVSAASSGGDVVSGGKASSGLPQSRRDRQREGTLEDVRRGIERLERDVEHGRRRLAEAA